MHLGIRATRLELLDQKIEFLHESGLVADLREFVWPVLRWVMVVFANTQHRT